LLKKIDLESKIKRNINLLRYVLKK